MPIYWVEGKMHYFAHVPKCGGTSIEAALSNNFGALGFVDYDFYPRPASTRWPKTTPQHLPYDEFTRLIPANRIESAFAVVRHPAERIVSAYNSLVSQGILRWQSFGEWMDRAMLPFGADNHGDRQADLAPQGAAIFRFEDGLGAVGDYLGRHHGIPSPVAIPHLNRTATRRATLAYRPPTDGEMRLIGAVYDEDYRLFYPEADRADGSRLRIACAPERRPFGIRSSLRRLAGYGLARHGSN